MKKNLRIKKCWIILLLLFIIFIDIILLSSIVIAKSMDISGRSTKDKIFPGETISYHFSGNNHFEVITNVQLDFEISYSKSIENRESSMEVKSNNNFTIKIDTKQIMKEFGFSESPKGPEGGQGQWQYKYNCIFRIQSNDSIEKLIFRFKKDLDYDLNPESEYSVSIYEEDKETWELVDTKEEEDGDDIYLEASIEDLSPDTEYYITLYEVDTEFPWTWILVIIIISILGIVIVMSKTDFINYLKTRHTYIEKGAHRLSLEEVLENKNRNKIIDLILKEPGIHFNELLRKTEIAAGNLVWHIDILETYKIIGKKRIGNFIAYFPYYQKNPISNIDLKLSKSKVTLEILKMVEKEPGIWINLIAAKKKLYRKTIQYHLEKLIELELITIKKEGRKKKIYPNIDSEYYQKDFKG